MLLANELLGRGMRESNRATARRVSKAERDAGVSAAAVVLLDAAEPGPDITLPRGLGLQQPGIHDRCAERLLV